MKFLVAGGENITEQARSTVEEIWRAPLYLTYGQTEAFGSIGIECREKDGYHRNDMHFIFELVDQNESLEGELIYTTLTRDVMPLIRYRSMDVTGLIDKPCACGLFAKRIAKIRGRCDEMVVCGMGNISPWVFAELLRGIERAGDEWQAVITNDGRRDVVELYIEVENPDDTFRRLDLEKNIHAHLRERFRDFRKNLEMQLYDLRIVPMARGSLRQARKLKRVIDERQMLLRNDIKVG